MVEIRRMLMPPGGVEMLKRGARHLEDVKSLLRSFLELVTKKAEAVEPVGQK